MLAQNYSEDPNSAPNGGDMGFVRQSDLERVTPELHDGLDVDVVEAVHVIHRRTILEGDLPIEQAAAVDGKKLNFAQIVTAVAKGDPIGTAGDEPVGLPAQVVSARRHVREGEVAIDIAGHAVAEGGVALVDERQQNIWQVNRVGDAGNRSEERRVGKECRSR